MHDDDLMTGGLILLASFLNLFHYAIDASIYCYKKDNLLEICLFVDIAVFGTRERPLCRDSFVQRTDWGSRHPIGVAGSMNSLRKLNSDQNRHLHL